MLERLGGSWQDLLQNIKYLNAYMSLTITWKQPNFNYLLCIRQHGSPQEKYHTISTGLPGNVTLKVALLSNVVFYSSVT